MGEKMKCCYTNTEGVTCTAQPVFVFWNQAKGYTDSFFHACRRHIGYMFEDDAEFVVGPIKWSV